MKKILILIGLVFLSGWANAQNKTFCIAKDGKVASIIVDETDWISVARAASDLSDDIRKVTGIPAEIAHTLDRKQQGGIVVGTIGKSKIIDQLIKKKKIDVSKIVGQWESYIIDVVDNNLIIAGSDKRGSIYGIYEVSQHIGVSPWYWWADIPVKQQKELYYNKGRLVQTSPSVKYRGIFINDEDWGLKPWSSKNYEKELGDIGPKTYARVCELLLRLKANMLAPAMHSCTGAFYSHPESKVVCDSFGIIITTSHCEPLLLNNAAKSEWDLQRDGDWNYKTNSKTIVKKWDDRLSEASQYENIYTTAMRGVHDAGLRGNLPMEERVPLITKVIDDQRQLLKAHIGKEPQEIPQIFVPYKETMDIYENGLRVPDDITLVWVDDNYGYMKRVSNPDEQKRSGRTGVYYHISYLGAPHDYLWINTTAPMLMYEELKKAYDNGADRYWLLNVGDIKPMELGIQTFMDIAWNIGAFSSENVNKHQAKFLDQIFPQSNITVYQEILDTYYRLAWSRKPEYMGWEREWDDKAFMKLRPTEFSFKHYNEAQQRLIDYQRISNQVEQLSDGSPAWYELIQFPVQAAYQMNRKFLMAQLNQELAGEGRMDEANWAALQMEFAIDSINALNRRYNTLLNGKWDGMMTVPPGICALYHKRPETIYTEGIEAKSLSLSPSKEKDKLSNCHVVNLNNFQSKDDNIQIVEGLGYDWKVVQMNGGDITYSLPEINRDSIKVILYTIPVWPLYAGKSNRLGISVDDAPMQVFENKFAEYSRSWKDQVLRNGASCTLSFIIDKKKTKHTITFHTIDKGQMIQRVNIDWGGLQSSYIGPNL